MGCKVLSVREPSILDFKNQVVPELGGSHDGTMEGSIVNDHHSKSLVERAVQTVGGMIRAHLLALVQ